LKRIGAADPAKEGAQGAGPVDHFGQGSGSRRHLPLIGQGQSGARQILGQQLVGAPDPDSLEPGRQHGFDRRHPGLVADFDLFQHPLAGINLLLLEPAFDFLAVVTLAIEHPQRLQPTLALVALRAGLLEFVAQAFDQAALLLDALFFTGTAARVPH
jgi:hypothetical protein